MNARIIFALMCSLAAAQPDSCKASPGGCPQTTEATDMSTLMQSRVRVGGIIASTVADDLSLEDEDAASSWGTVGVDSDHLGQLEAAGEEGVEHVDDEEIGFEEMEEGYDGTPVDPADDPNMAPYLEDLIEYEEATEMAEFLEEDTENGDEELEEYSSDNEAKERAAEQQAAFKESVKSGLDHAATKEAVKKHPRALGDVEHHVDEHTEDVGLVDESDQISVDEDDAGLSHTGHPQHCGGTLKCELYVMSVWCNSHSKWMGHKKSLTECAQAVHGDKSFVSNSFSYGKNVKKGKCYKMQTKSRRCPEGFRKDDNYDFYFVADFANPMIYSVYPDAGSIVGGTVVTIEGHGLYEAHDPMKQTGSTASSLMPPLQIFLAHVASGFKLSCSMESFESREDSIKFVTPSILQMRNLTNLPLAVLVFKRVNGVLKAAGRLAGGGLTYTYSSGATPTLAKVTPHAAGAGETITLMAWSCSGIVEAEPVLLVSTKGNATRKTSSNNSGGVVSNPQDGWGHVCDPFPPIAVRTRHKTNKNDPNAKATGQEYNMRGAQGVELGAAGLDLVYYELSTAQKKRYGPLDTQPKIQDFLDKHPIMRSKGRDIVQSPYLPYSQYWNKATPGQEKTYVAKLTAFLKIMTPGMYEFRMNTYDAGWIKVGTKLLTDVRRRRRPTAGWGHWGELWSDKLKLDRGWEKLALAHWAHVLDPKHSALEVRYKGPDTQSRWTIIPKENLRSGIWFDDIKDQLLNQPNGQNTKYLTPAHEIGQATMPIGMARCPGGSQAKLVTFRCTVSKDMSPGFYNVEFNDHRFGNGAYKPAQWDIGMGKEQANLRIVPVVDEVTAYNGGQNMMVKGKGLDGLMSGPFHFEDYAFKLINGTQDHLELEKKVKIPGLTPTVFGARGLLREMWLGKYEWPDTLESKHGIKPSWERGSSLKTKIEQSKYISGTGFSERLSGLFTPPFSGTCRWRMQGTQLHHSSTANQAKLYVSTTPNDGNVANQQTATVDPPRTKALFRYPGAALDGSRYEDLAGWFPLTTSFGGSASFAFTARWDKKNEWSRVFSFGTDIWCNTYWRHPSLRCTIKRGRSESHLDAGHVITDGKDIDVLFTIQAGAGDKGYAEILINGLLAANKNDMYVPEKRVRSKLRLGENKFDGEISNFQMYNNVVTWYDAFGKPKVSSKDAVVGVMIKPDMYAKHIHWHYLGKKSSVNECAEEVSKKLSNNMYFVFGKRGKLMQCYQIHTVHVTGAPRGWGFTWDWDTYIVKTLSHNPQPAIVYPAAPIVMTDAANEKTSAYVAYDAGKSYPFKLERRVAARTSSTGMDGWKKLGLECKTLSGAGSALLPRPLYAVSMKLKEYPLTVKLPKSPTAYKVSFMGNDADVLNDRNAGPALLSLFGAKCKVQSNGAVTLVDFEPSESQKAVAPDSQAYCGIGAATAPTKADGTWVHSHLTLASPKVTKYLYLRDFPFLHMCIKIEPKAIVNMVIKAKVGGRRREQEFSVLLTDTRTFHRDRKHAAIFTNELKIVNGTTTGQWECGSIDLMGQVMSWQSNPRRFWDIDYRKGPTGTGKWSPSYELAQMQIVDIKLMSGYHHNHQWQKLGGKVSVDMLALSKNKYSVAQTGAAPMQHYPFKSVEDHDTSIGWKVEWFSHYRDFLGKYNYAAKTPDVITRHKNIRLKDCRPAWTTRRCDHYGWRATGTINIPSDGDYKFYYSNDDDMWVFVDGVSSGHLRCCSGWGRWRTTKVFKLKAGPHKIEAHMYQGGGGNYGALKWSKDGKIFFDETMSSPGTSKDHYVKFFPKKRAEFNQLKTFLGSIKVKGAAATVAEPLGAPPVDDVQVTLEPPDLKVNWKDAVKQDRRNPAQDLNVGEVAFNKEFKKCPVVRYARDDKTYAIYVRDSAIPSNFNAYKLFTENWGSPAFGASANALKKDMNIYSTLQDVNNAGKRWQYHSVDNTGFPGNSGKSSRQDHYSFRMKHKGGIKGAFKATLEIWDTAGAVKCPSQFGSSSSVGTSATATFSMSDSDAVIMSKIKQAGLPQSLVTVTNRNGYKQMALQNAVQSTDHDQRYGHAKDAIDGKATCTWRNGISHTKKDSSPWWRADLADDKGNVVDVDVLRVRVKSRSDCCPQQISGFDLYVDGVNGRTKCASNVQMSQDETKDVTCVATGSSIMIVLPRHEHLVLCEVQVFVADTASKGSTTEYDKFELVVASSKRGSLRKLVFSSKLVDSVNTITASSGARFFADVTDFWFRMPYSKNQVSFATDYSSYVASGVSGTAPGASSKNLSSGATPMTLFQRSHSVRGQVSHTTRREPPRRWRLPPQYHTEETLEALSRRVLSSAASPRNWAEASALLQTHADHQQHALFKKGEVDPRDDKTALRWSSPASWGGEAPPTGANTDIIYFPAGKTGMLDMNVNIKFWVLEGNLVWDMTKSLSMGAEAVVVNGGQFLIGKETVPYTKKGLILLQGHWHTMKLPLCGAKTIFQTMGVIEMHGIPVSTTWTDLENTVGVGSTQIEVRTAVKWQPGDHIVIAASDKIVKDCRMDRRDDCHVEERYVKMVDSTGKKIELDRPLVYRHVGEELEPYMASKAHCIKDPALCLKTQVRAEVGLLTRNIVVKGSNYDDGTGPPGSEGFGGHLMHAERARYTYIEFHWMGQAFQMGRYPLHLHLTGLNPWSKIVGCSLHRTFNRGITVHGTHASLLQDNVVYNTLAHSYFIEDGNEHDNIFEHNLGMMTHPSFSLLVSDQTPATFWIRNPSNYFRNNHAAGSHSFGFWFDTLKEAAVLVQRQFENNTAHSNGNTGLWVDIVDPLVGCFASDQWTISVPGAAGSRVATPKHTAAPVCKGKGAMRKRTDFISTTTWGNADHGIVLFETGHINIINHRSVSDTNGIVFWGMASDTWPDVTNNWNGPTIRLSAYHTNQAQNSVLPFSTKCAIGGPWDDTFFITGTNFIGGMKTGGFCPCFFCLNNEGGYEIRTSDLGWFEGAGTPQSPKVNFPWIFSSFFFDMDGTLTEQSSSCKAQGCYLHAPFDISPRAGMYIRGITTTTSTTVTGGGALSFLEDGAEVGSMRCLVSLVGRAGNTILPDSSITASSDYHSPSLMSKTRIDETSSPTWCAKRNDNKQYLAYNFSAPKWITAVQTQGRYRHDQWVTFYKLECKETDGSTWKPIQGQSIYDANRNRNTVVENRIVPTKCKQFRIHVEGWHRHVSMRADLLGCDGTSNLTKVCMDKPFLNAKQQDCRTLERSLGPGGMKDFCTNAGHKFWFTALSANQACCACGGGDIYYTAPSGNSTKKIPTKAVVQTVPGGTGYAPPHLCHVVDSAGGVVCERSSRLQSVTLKFAGIWHEMQTIDVQTDYGYAAMEWVGCYKQYEFSVFQNMRHMLVPPYTPKSLYDWDEFKAEAKLREGDTYVLQWETIHNPDGYTVKMSGIKKKFYCNQAPVQYGSSFLNNPAHLNALSKVGGKFSANKLGLSLKLDMYKMAHKPLLATAGDAKSAANWGYIPANTSYNMRYWYPGTFQLLLSTQGIISSTNVLGPWSGKRANINEKMPTRPINRKADAADPGGFSHIETPITWTRWDTVPAPPGGAPPPPGLYSRLEYIYKFCGFEPASLALSDAFATSSQALARLAQHKAVKASKVKVAQVAKFDWSAWPAQHGGKPVVDPKVPDEGVGNVTIEANWEVTLDEDVDFINKLNISGILKFKDMAGCCKLVARYIFVGPLVGKLAAGTVSNPIALGKAHIILKGHPITPTLKTWFPNLASSAKWLKNKFIAVQGTLDLYGKQRTKTWVKLAKTSPVNTTQLTLEPGSDFVVGDTITINAGAETRTVVAVTGDVITLDRKLLNSYKGLDYIHLGDANTKGLMASAVGLIGGHTVVVEGEDTEGIPMCDRSVNHTCPYSSGLPGGMSLHDFAKDLRYWAKKTGRASHPSCRPCRAVSDQAHSGYIIAMAYWHRSNNRCPKDHGVVHASNVEFRHGSSMALYHGYTGYEYPQIYDSFDWEWSKRQFPWWSDPVWKELNHSSTGIKEHLIENSAFNNSFCGTAVAMATSGIKTVNLAPVKGNVFLMGGIGINAAARAGGPVTMLPWFKDLFSPRDDNAETVTMGVGSPNDEGNPLAKKKHIHRDYHGFTLEENLLSGAPLISLHNGVVRNNMIFAPVKLEGGPVGTISDAKFTGNTVSTDGKACVQMRNGGTNGISDSVLHSCPGVALGFSHVGMARGVVTRMTILNSGVGIYYFVKGADGKAHSTDHVEFQVADTKIYSKADGSGTAVQNPKVHSVMLGEPLAPDWWQVGPMFHPIGHSSISLYFRSKFDSVTFAGFDKSKGGAVLTVGEGGHGDRSDQDFHPMMFSNIALQSVNKDALFRFQKPTSVGFSKLQCIQIDCDGRRNSLVIDEDGSFIGKPGTVIPEPDKFYDKLTYVDPMGFDTMEDLIPMPARYDRFGDAIPFPTAGPEVTPGTCGGLEYKCNLKGGCDVLFMDKGYWKPRGLPKIPTNGKIVATREDGGLIRLDPIHHGWQYATGWVKTSECTLVMNPKTCAKPESQHARRYGRVAAGQFGTHINTTRVGATKGPVYSLPGIYRKGCTHNSDWSAWECTGGKHRHLAIEVMDWNHMTRRWAPVSVEVNDNYAPQGGYMNILTGCAMYWIMPNMRLQTFHALGHVGLRHNVYFSGDPPKHLRLHFQYAKKTEKIIASVYYGIPNNLAGYVNNKEKVSPKGFTPTWDNLVFNKLTTNMDHGTFYYDRIGVETGRPGYLYVVIAGDSYVDFKISHKVVLTTKITVNTVWGGWKDPNNKNNFFKKGINGLVRNIALLIGCPPTRIKILGNGTAKPGTFWNANTTSTTFAKWMWGQNKSMNGMNMSNWKNAPGAKLKNGSTLLQTSDAVLQDDVQTVSFLSQFAEHRHQVIRTALDAGQDWYRHISLLTNREVDAILERLTVNELHAQGERNEASLFNMRERAESSQDGEVTYVVDDDTSTALPPANTATLQEAKDAGALEHHSDNKAELKIEQQSATPIATMFSGSHNSATQLSLLADLANSTNTSQTLTNLQVDNQPTKFNPMAWTCDHSKWGDGLCDCECGTWDPDCDNQTLYGGSTYSVAAFNNGSSALTLADEMQVAALMNWLDADGNGNGLLDGDELAKVATLGASALHGLAKKIETAQSSAGGDAKISWKGNFANRVQAVATNSCNHKLADRVFTDKIATETPVCVKDTYWDKIVNTPTGHCALLPKMKQGSQCVVPGDGIPLKTNLTGSALVCTQIFKIFPGASGKKAGGILGTNAGVTSAELWSAGGTFIPGTSKHVLHKLDLVPAASFPSFIGRNNGFSVYFKLKTQSWANNGQVFEVCTKLIPPNTCRDCGKTNCRYCFRFFAANNGDGRTDPTMDMRFEATWETSRNHHGRTYWRTYSKGSATIKANLNADEEYLATVDMKNKRLEINKFGITIESGAFRFYCGVQDSTNLKIGDGADADITDIRIWPKVVNYAVATAGHPPGQQASPGTQKPSGVVNMNCISSKRNTWDFVCADEVPDHLSMAFGYGSPATRKARTAFNKKKQFGKVVECPYTSLGAKAMVFKGHFGDGLTGEYFQMMDINRHQRHNKFSCGRPPFVFGLFPRKVQVDKTLTYDTSLAGKSHVAVSHNDLVIRWTGNILISQGGTYTFSVVADDAAWLSIDGRLVLEAYSRDCRGDNPKKKTGSTKLLKGSHTIAILYANYAVERHGKKYYDGSFSITYSGLDTAGNTIPIPPRALGSAPLRLASLAKNLKTNISNATVIPGQFVWDDAQKIATMPKGSCERKCRMGLLKNAATSFKFFCSSDTAVSFQAEVSLGARTALIWLDNQGGAKNWDMSSWSLVQQQDLEEQNENEQLSFLEDTSTDQQILSAVLGLNDSSERFVTRTSPASPEMNVLAGEHTIFFQGTPDTDKSFSFKSISFVKGGNLCKFFLEGKDKSAQECNA